MGSNIYHTMDIQYGAGRLWYESLVLSSTEVVSRFFWQPVDGVLIGLCQIVHHHIGELKNSKEKLNYNLTFKETFPIILAQLTNLQIL